MAITNMGYPNGYKGARFDYMGLSSDTKPTNTEDHPMEVNSLFLELDTGDVYYYTGESWAKVGG